MHTVMSVAFISGAGICFMLANLVMKTMGQSPMYVLYPAIAVTFAAGAYFEVEALKHSQLGYAVTFILACELVLSLAVAIMFFRESYSTGNLLGIAFVVIGVALLHLPSGQSMAQLNAQAQSNSRR